MKVGLCWCGSRGHKNDRNRSIPFDLVRPLASVPGVQWQSLVIGEREDEAIDAPWLTKAGDRFASFLSTGLFMLDLDLVLTVDSAVAHLAGALGVPCWLMVPLVPDFRWQLHRDDSPWYPRNFRLYRQTKAQDWEGVIRRVMDDLQQRQEAA